MLRKNNKRMPDVLDCLANLSNDEVFTPPEVANKMLDLLPQEVFASKETTFLDPFTKSGVFLREITKRLLAHQIPNYEEMSGEIDEIEKTAIQEAVKSGILDLQDADYDDKAKKIGRDAISLHPRVGEFHEFEEKLQKELNRILKTQVFGIAITELTAQLTRRSLYCSKNAAGKYSIGTEFDNEDGNIRFKSCQHVWDKKPKWVDVDKKWKGGTCIFCGATSEMFERPNDLEQHAYEFIHTLKAEELFNMKFDVVCGNPPYQLEVNAETKQAKPIYHHFVEQAKRLNPKYLTMIIPARWFSGGIGLEDFRTTMMKDKHISHIVDYPNAKECFPSNSIGGGVCYFLRDASYTGPCQFTNVNNGEKKTITRSLDEFSTVVRYNNAVNILHKIQAFGEESITSVISPLMPFGLPSNYRGVANKTEEKNIALHSSKDITYISKDEIARETTYLDKYKIFMSKLGAEHAGEPGKDGKFRVITTSIKVVPPKTACTHSYFVVGESDNEQTVKNTLSYIETRFVRFLVLLTVSSINLSKASFAFVPMQDFSKPWTDEELYKKYGLTEEEVEFIESLVKPMYEKATKEDK